WFSFCRRVLTLLHLPSIPRDVRGKSRVRPDETSPHRAAPYPESAGNTALALRKGGRRGIINPPAYLLFVRLRARLADLMRARAHAAGQGERAHGRHQRAAQH